MDVFFDSWDDTVKKVTSTCNGVFASERSNCSSVSSFNGIRFSIPIRIGRISWCSALPSSITNTFSRSRISLDGKSLIILIGILSNLFSSYTHISFHNTLILRILQYAIHFPKRSTNISSEIIGMPRLFAFWFFDDVDSISLFTR